VARYAFTMTDFHHPPPATVVKSSPRKKAHVCLSLGLAADRRAIWLAQCIMSPALAQTKAGTVQTDAANEQIIITNTPAQRSRLRSFLSRLLGKAKSSRLETTGSEVLSLPKEKSAWVSEGRVPAAAFLALSQEKPCPNGNTESSLSLTCHAERSTLTSSTTSVVMVGNSSAS
jgi:hypothetical protein